MRGLNIIQLLPPDLPCSVGRNQVPGATPHPPKGKWIVKLHTAGSSYAFHERWFWNSQMLNRRITRLAWSQARRVMPFAASWLQRMSAGWPALRTRGSSARGRNQGQSGLRAGRGGWDPSCGCLSVALGRAGGFRLFWPAQGIWRWECYPPAAPRERGGQKGSAPKHHDSSAEAGQRWLFCSCRLRLGPGGSGGRRSDLAALTAGPAPSPGLANGDPRRCAHRLFPGQLQPELGRWAGADKCWRLRGSLKVAARGWIACAVTRHRHRCGWRLGQLVAPATPLRSTTNPQSLRGAPRALGFHLAVGVRKSVTNGCQNLDPLSLSGPFRICGVLLFKERGMWPTLLNIYP